MSWEQAARRAVADAAGDHGGITCDLYVAFREGEDIVNTLEHKQTCPQRHIRFTEDGTCAWCGSRVASVS